VGRREQRDEVPGRRRLGALRGGEEGGELRGH
jgi:hypothetical protein